MLEDYYSRWLYETKKSIAERYGEETDWCNIPSRPPKVLYHQNTKHHGVGHWTPPEAGKRRWNELFDKILRSMSELKDFETSLLEVYKEDFRRMGVFEDRKRPALRGQENAPKVYIRNTLEIMRRIGSPSDNNHSNFGISLFFVEMQKNFFLAPQYSSWGL